MFIKSTILRSPHAFATRRGGVSELEHTKSLNLAFGRGDSDETVLKNLEFFAKNVGFDPKNVVSLPQIHSNIIYKVDRSDCGKGYFVRDGIDGGDGYITDRKGVVLGVKTADCVPILFEAERDGKTVAVGAVHAGWRGSVAKIAPKCVSMMCESYGVSPSDVRACIGPCIHKCCYEVGEDLLSSVADAFGEELAAKFVTGREGSENKFSCDLVGLNRYLLTDCGILPQNLDVIDRCTCCEPDTFFSHRYSGGLRGTMLNVIFMQS